MTRTKRSNHKASAAPRGKLSRKGFQEQFDGMVSNIGKVIKGKDDVIRLSLIAILGDGHILFEDVPGTGKTMLARGIAQTIDARAARIQCTPDLLPADITGSPVLERKTGDFVFRPGPIFANVFLSDEINRATPKTQSALLEAMQERTVTVDARTYPLPAPFFVMATQNPIELAGTFPLPEAQLDRFLFKLSLGYADRSSEMDVLQANRKGEAIENLGAVVGAEDVLALMDWASDVSVSEDVIGYIVDLIRATREDPALHLGASTRASLALMRSSRVLAASQGRDDVLPDDVKALAPPALAHRLILTPDAMLREETVEQAIERIVAKVKVPVGVRSARVRGPEAEAAVASAG